MLCNWNTYNGYYCKTIINKSDQLCEKHKLISCKYKIIKDCELCDTNREIKISPRNKIHVDFMLGKNKDETVQVIFSGNSIELANISNPDYIELESDGAKFFYNQKSSISKIKIILKDYCKNNAIVNTPDGNFCEECYKKQKIVPKINTLSISTSD